jgi:predicted permease
VGVLLVVVLVAILAVTGLLVWVTARAFPQTSGNAAIPGLAANVTVIRDATGIAHITADTTHDLFMAQGYVHASERMWQMEVWRHISAGRLAELFGASQVKTDKFIRTLGWRVAAQRDLDAMGPDGRLSIPLPMMVVQVLLAIAAGSKRRLVALIGSGLLLRSHAKLSHVNPGYSTRDLYTFQIAPEQRSLVDGPSYARFSMAFMDRMRALRDVESVGLIENVPLDEGTAVSRFRTENMAEDAAIRLNVTFASEDYYKTIGIRVIEGRPFTREDSISTLGNVVISRSAAKLLWPDGSALGRKLQRERFETWETVVGVVDDVMQENFRDPPQALVYFPLTGQLPTQWRLPSPAYVVKTSRAETIAPEIRALVRELAPEAPMYRAYTMAFLADRSMRDLSFTTLTLALVSALALILGVVGLYGALSYVVAERTREIGVRMALGAQPGRVRRMVVAQGAQVVIAGIAIGLAVAYFSTRALGRLLYGVAPLDLATFVGMAVSMLLAGLVASYVPARRASNVDPIRSLRAD